MVGIGTVLAIVLVGGVAIGIARVGWRPVSSSIPMINKIVAPARNQQQQVYVAIVKGTSTNGSMTFSPDNVQIQPGTTVIWRNDDNTPHTVTSGKGMNDTSKGKIFDSGPIAAGKTFSYKFDIAGSYDYFCIPHPTMIGTVTVK